MTLLIYRIALWYISFVTLCSAQVVDDSLAGTWTSKSKTVFTGPSLYNPVKDKFNEPTHPGISYSFTSDGYYESAYYRAISNPIQPACPSATLQWQHGKYTIEANGSLVLKPFAVDGRQIMSRPCSYDQSVYTRYSQPELIEKYEVITDPFHNIKRLNLFRFDGAPYQPLYLAYSPPQMLPTVTLNPTASATGSSAKETGKPKRSVDDYSEEELMSERMEPMNKHAILTPSEPFNADRWWWVGAGLTAAGTALYLYPSS